MKDESELVEARRKKFKKLGVDIWDDPKVFGDLLQVAWTKILRETPKKKAQEIVNNVRVFIKLHDDFKYLRNLGYLYGEFVGEAGGKSGIVIYIDDILQVNCWQKELVQEHIYFILKHELSHYYGLTHEQMHQRENFGYPGQGKE